VVASPDRCFGPDYLEQLVLRDGSRVQLRLIRASDKERLTAGLAQLSPQSRYLRFFTDKDRLTDGELRYFTEVDGEDHFALGVALLEDDGSEGEGVGIGRFVRLRDEPKVAEPALAVLDAMQGQGLGRLLMLRLISAATERGVERFRCDFLAINRSMGDLLRNVSSGVVFKSDGPVVTAEFPLPNVAPDVSVDEAEQGGPMLSWLKLAAEQVVQLRRRLTVRSEHVRERWHELQDEITVRARKIRGDEES